MTTPAGLYIHIPFCDAKCSYCDFVTFTDQHHQIDSYLKAVAFELSAYRGRAIETLFVGGGTPTVLSPKNIDFLMSAVHRTMDTSLLHEATVEANPESAGLDRLLAYRNGGINRLSFGLQATQNALLQSLGRLHSREKFLSVFYLARAAGFENINVDLMFGLPGQTWFDWRGTLREVIALEPEHVSAYALKVEPGTKMGRDHVTVDGDLEADMYLLAAEQLKAAGYVHYEISNFAKPGKESQHNLRYWKNEDTIGVGIASASYLDGKRYKNTNRLKTYIDDCLGGRIPVREKTQLPSADVRKESIMLGLRLNQGVAVDVIEEMKIPMTSTFLARGLATVEKGMYSLTPQGWLLSNLLFQQLV